MYRLRFIVIMLKCLFAKPKGLQENFDLEFRTVPFFDTDVSRFFTQTYASYMGLARWHYIFASTFKRVAIKNKWAPVATSEYITYKRSIKAGERVLLRTNLLCWTDQRFYLRQSFLVGGELRAVALVEGSVRSPKGVLNPIEAFRTLGVTEASPPPPAEIKAWKAL